MGNSKRTIEDLRARQALPLEAKEIMTEVRIHEWQYNGNFGVETGVVSFSGGKDSTVLFHIARKLYPNIPAVFSNTGLEYPEIQQFVKKFDNVKIVRPKMRFDDVISKYGYPLIGKEVAEAIYYARRIRPSAERERERETAVQLARTFATTYRKRAELVGKRGGAEPPHPDEYSEKPPNSSQRTDARSRGREWQDWRRGCL